MGLLVSEIHFKSQARPSQILEQLGYIDFVVVSAQR